MDNLPSSLQALSTEDVGGQASEPTKASAQVSPSTPARPSLETLPIELQRLILSASPGLPSLNALVHASPELHRVYAAARMPVLCRLLEQTLHGIHAAALAAHRSGTADFQATRTHDSLWAFVGSLEDDGSAPAPDWTAELSLHDIIRLLRFHVSVAEPLTEAYARWALDALPSSSSSSSSQQRSESNDQDATANSNHDKLASSLSESEARRIQRAVYRLQMFSNLCGSQGEGRSSPARIESNLDRLRILSLLPAWEVEEMLSVHMFAKDRYSGIFKQVAWDLDEERNPKYRHIDMTSVNQDLQLVMDESVNNRSLNAVLRYGPHLLADTLKAKGQDKLAEMTRAAIVSGMGEHRGLEGNDWIDDAVLDGMTQGDRRELWPTQYDAAQNSRQKTPFDGDSLAFPPLAWVLFWQGEYSSLFGPIYVPETLRRWGFVMWDAARLDANAKAAIEDAWYGTDFTYADPREEDYDLDVRE